MSATAKLCTCVGPFGKGILTCPAHGVRLAAPQGTQESRLKALGRISRMARYYAEGSEPDGDQLEADIATLRSALIGTTEDSK